MPVKVLYGKLKTGVGGTRLRSVLVVVQFTISIILIMSSFVIYKQIHYMVNKDLGFDKEQLLVIRRTDSLQKKIKAFKEELKRMPSIVNVANSTAIPGYPNNNNGFQIEGRPAEQAYLMWVNWVDYDYLETYKIKLTNGRLFSREFSSDTAVMIINEEAVRRFGLQDPFSTRFIQSGRTLDERTYHPVLAINKDFHNQSLRQEIEPHVFMIKPDYWDWSGYVTIRLEKENLRETLIQLENVWKEFTNGEPLQYFFLDKEFEQFYKEEKRTAKIAVAFSFLAIFIASLGLFGLTSFATEQRAREISLRKVLGSSVKSIIMLFTKEFSILVSLAILPAGIISYYFMNKWLQNFEYHISLGYIEFLSSILIVLVIALLTVGYRTYKAALTNPAEILKYE
jgi:putative ABC transport system permease protein